MNYDELFIIIQEISEAVSSLREDGIESTEKILKHIKLVHKIIPNDLKELIITKPLLVNACCNSIIKRVDDYTNQYPYETIITRLQNKEITTSQNLDLIFKKCLDFMIEHQIIKIQYDTNYVPIEKIEPTPEPQPEPDTIEKQTPRINQQEAYDRLKKNGYETGIHCQATGCGKTNIILHYIDYGVKNYKNKTKIILFTERVNILKDLFDFTKNGNEPNKYNILKWKHKGIADLENVDFINRVTIKKNDWMHNLIESTKATVLVINRAYLTADINKYDMMKGNITLILHDECHNTSSERCNQFLLKAKEYNIPIVGFSATPLRTGRNDKDKLLEIYGDSNGFLKLLTNYNMIYAIQQNLILPPEFYWYHVELKTLNEKKEEDKLEYELECAFEILNNLIPKLPNKKIVTWCGKIKSTEKWKELFEQKHTLHKTLQGFKFYLDTSQNGDQDYEEFKHSEGKAILFCANKHREGSDIKKLDACMFLDGVIKRGCVPFIQSIGRVLRKDNERKLSGIVIDAIYKYDDYEKDFVDKIIGYYVSLQNLSEENNSENASENYDKYLELKNIIKFDQENEMIHLKFNNNDISINVNKLKWNDIIYKFNNVLEKKIKSAESNKLLADFKILKSIAKENNIKSSFQYNQLYEKLKIIQNPEYIFNTYWKGWYDFLSIDTSIYPSTKLELKLKLNILNINNTQEYYSRTDQYKLPVMPDELYPDFIDFNDLFDINTNTDTSEIYITEKELSKINLTYSEILECLIKDGEKLISDKRKYRQIVTDIWLTMSRDKIIETTTFNIKLTNENGLSGYDWIPELNMSYQGKDANKTMKEIVNMIKINNYSIKISIKLKSEKIINFRINKK